MVDRADLIVCCIEHENGGAWHTVQYAMEQGKTVINLANEDETVNLL
jgi:predicted Rossmann fold nucleotide-binding protein DprA/Smf involved in DNA uptake